MAHKHDVDGPDGDILDRAYFCSDYCHKEWCDTKGIEYAGWDGCHELEFDAACDQCEKTLPGVEGPYID